jgi:hypothetical protein
MLLPSDTLNAPDTKQNFGVLQMHRYPFLKYLIILWKAWTLHIYLHIQKKAISASTSQHVTFEPATAGCKLASVCTNEDILHWLTHESITIFEHGLVNKFQFPDQPHCCWVNSTGVLTWFMCYYRLWLHESVSCATTAWALITWISFNW